MVSTLNIDFEPEGVEIDFTTGTLATVEVLNGSAQDDVVFITGTQLDTFTTLNFNDGFDVLLLDSTSINFNALSDGDLQGLEYIFSPYAPAGIVINTSAQTEMIYISGSDFNDTITAGSGNDSILGLTGVDILDGGAGDDFFYLRNDDFVAGETITGGLGTDTIIFMGATTVDFSTGTLATVENLVGFSLNDNVTLSFSQLSSFTNFNLHIGTDTLNVKFSGVNNIIVSPLPSISLVEIGNIVGSAGNDIVTMTGAQMNTLLIGPGTINMGAGFNRFSLTSTSTDLNTLGATDGSIVGVKEFDFGLATAAVTLNLSGQTEGFFLNASIYNDVITGGSGDDSLYGDQGVDNINGGAGNDTFFLYNGEFAVGESLTGGLGTDDITLINAPTVDFTTGTLATIEVLNGSTGDDDVIISGTQLNSFTTLDFNDGTDTLYITSTSTGLNALANGSLTGLENISASTAGAGVTLSVASQTEGFTLAGSGFNDTLTGGSGNDIIDGGAGNDVIRGGAGNDIIYGGDGLDDLYGQGGADTFVLELATAFNNIERVRDFSPPQSDALDIKDLLSGYTYGVDDLTQFVQVNNSGANSTVFVDVTGSGTFGAATQVALIYGVTGATDEVVIEAAGYLITH